MKKQLQDKAIKSKEDIEWDVCDLFDDEEYLARWKRREIVEAKIVKYILTVIKQQRKS